MHSNSSGSQKKCRIQGLGELLASLVLRRSVAVPLAVDCGAPTCMWPVEDDHYFMDRLVYRTQAHKEWNIYLYYRGKLGFVRWRKKLPAAKCWPGSIDHGRRLVQHFFWGFRALFWGLGGFTRLEIVTANFNCFYEEFLIATPFSPYVSILQKVQSKV
ncbi:hypothetical protein VNO78_35924 [Psophocarpus tetragonolobus]|uniref:Uncharacterized protein n=1 Tax=Psophocarpus tetragonolobus TaxID=3891 RepID=A0AAN9RGE6_PSOTE